MTSIYGDICMKLTLQSIWIHCSALVTQRIKKCLTNTFDNGYIFVKKLGF